MQIRYPPSIAGTRDLDKFVSSSRCTNDEGIQVELYSSQHQGNQATKAVQLTLLCRTCSMDLR